MDKWMVERVRAFFSIVFACSLADNRKNRTIPERIIGFGIWRVYMCIYEGTPLKSIYHVKINNICELSLFVGVKGKVISKTQRLGGLPDARHLSFTRAHIHKSLKNKNFS